MAKCSACNGTGKTVGTGKTGTYTYHKCYRCSGSGKQNKRGKGKRR